MISTPVVADNIATARRLVAQAARDGAGLVLLPEYWPIMGMHENDKVAVAETAGRRPDPGRHGGDGARTRHLADRRHAAAGRAGAGQGAQYHAGLRSRRQRRRALRQDPPVRLQPAARNRYDESRTIAAGSEVQTLRHAVRPRRPVGLLRPALSGTVPGDGRPAA